MKSHFLILKSYNSLLVLITVVCTDVDEEDETNACLVIRFDCCVHKPVMYSGIPTQREPEEIFLEQNNVGS